MTLADYWVQEFWRLRKTMPVSEARRHADLAARALVKRGQSLGYKWEVGQHLDGEMLAAAQASKVAD